MTDKPSLSDLGLDDESEAAAQPFGKVFDTFDDSSEQKPSETWVDRVEPPRERHWLSGCLPLGCLVAFVVGCAFILLVVVSNIGRQPEPSLESAVERLIDRRNAVFMPESQQKCIESFKIDGQTLVLTVGDGYFELSPVDQRNLLMGFVDEWGSVKFRGKVVAKTWNGAILAEIDCPATNLDEN